MALPKSLLDLARDPNVHPEKFAALVTAYHVEQEINATLAFQAAFLKMQPEIPVIDEHGTITYRDGRTGTYATNEDIQIAIAPILNRHGFTLTFSTQYPSQYAIRVEGILTHKKGHSKSSFFESQADGSGGKTFAQGRGSIISYGHRYCTVDLLNLVTKGEDNDGATGGEGLAFVNPETLPTNARAVYYRLAEAATGGLGSLQSVWSELHQADRELIGVAAFEAIKRGVAVSDAGA